MVIACVFKGCECMEIGREKCQSRIKKVTEVVCV